MTAIKQKLIHEEPEYTVSAFSLDPWKAVKKKESWIRRSRDDESEKKRWWPKGETTWTPVGW
ncbi:MAG: hypothetical protein HQL97_01070 [Magnetococcales bacterium]|nr:hypothetical protein [Magnetococcales bacterium]